MHRLLAFILVSLGIVGGSLPPPEQSYKILILVPMSPRSHRNVFIPLGNALAERGHEVSMLSGYPVKDSKFKNYQHSLFSHPEIKDFHYDNLDMFELSKDIMEFSDTLIKVQSFYYEHIFDEEVVELLYKRRNEFDLFIFDRVMNEAMYPFAFNKTHISISTEGLGSYSSAVFGNFINPAYATNFIQSFPLPYSFVHRVLNVVACIAEGILSQRFQTSSLQSISKRFPELHPILDIANNQSLVFLNGHFSFSDIVPILPNQIEVGCMHCRPGNPLPEELESFLSGDTPVVYMSMGSIARSSLMPQEYKRILVQVFSKLPYKVLWKFEDDSLGQLPDNIMIKNWLPQQDILAHKNVKVFISHCGLLGSQEAMYHATPIIGMPLIGDQPRNIIKWQSKGVGRALYWDELTEELMTETINDVMNNPKYHERVSAISANIRDQLESPVERAVYWTEYVIRHQGAVHLRSPELDLSWIQLLHLDILFLVHLVIFVVYKILKKFLGFCFNNEINVKVKTH